MIRFGCSGDLAIVRYSIRSLAYTIHDIAAVLCIHNQSIQHSVCVCVCVEAALAARENRFFFCLHFEMCS